jgi:iron complex outermembrane receptor protein
MGGAAMEHGLWEGGSKAVVAALLAAGLVQPAAAQEAATAEPADGIQDIIVTAQKRDQSVQDVGIALSVVTGDALAQSGAASVTDLTAVVPNVQANYGAGQVAFNVRGIGTNEFSANLDAPVAVNIDEVYLSKTFMTGLLLFDVDRVEALKGPQGTLFGRNATGGAINFFTRRPTDAFAAGTVTSFDNYETLRTDSYVSGPIADNLAFRVSGLFVDQGKGWYRNSTLGRREGAEKKWALRGQLQWTGASTTALFTLWGGRQTGELIPYEGVGVFTPASLAAGTPQFCPEYLAGRARGSTANCRRGTDGGFPGDDDPFTSMNNRPHRVRNESFGTSLRIEHDFGPSTLTSISSYQRFIRDQDEDSDGTPVDVIDVAYFSRIRQITQEVRLSSNGTGRWNYVAGLYYQNDNFRNGDYLTVAGGAAPGFWSPFTQKANAFAAFLHNNVELTDRLSLTAGVRYSWERIKLDGGTFAGTGIVGRPERPSTIVAPLAVAQKQRTDDDANYKIGLEWRPVVNADWLDKLLVYGSISNGFRSGSFNAAFVSSPEQLTSLAPEKITAYEIGFKSNLARRTMQLNGSLFHYDFKDGFINVDSPSSPVPITINAAAISTWGVELEWLWQPTGDLTFDGEQDEDAPWLHLAVSATPTIAAAEQL